METTSTLPETPPAPLPMRRYRWWYKGMTTEGNTCSFSGTGRAPDADTAAKNIETMMRGQHPTIRWMSGKQIEDPTRLTFGPTIQMGAVLKPKPNVPAHLLATDHPRGT